MLTGHTGRFAYCAPATPPGVSGIAVIRMSGRSSFEIADDIFVSESRRNVTVYDMEPYTCAYGEIRDPRTGETADKVVLTKFSAPNSYTGEDTIEISCHGGTAVREKILDLLYVFGARPAEPGEFSRNAFLNGKMDLAQAEAVMDLISSQADKASSQAIGQMKGNLSSRIREINNSLYRVLAELEMALEFPEHEDGRLVREHLISKTDELLTDISGLTDSFRQGRILREGFTVAIAGKPNAGKSSLLNIISGHDRSIVTDIPGTTRDTVEEIVNVGGLPVKIIDTAGIRDSSDMVEQLGVGRAKEAIGSADLVLWVIDEYGNTEETLQDEFRRLTDSWINSHKGRFAVIISKIDIKPFDNILNEVKRNFPDFPVIPFSSVTGEGLDEVRVLITNIYNSFGNSSSEEIIITNSRHLRSLRQAQTEISIAHEGMVCGSPLDVLASALRKASESLAEITGDEVSEKLIQEIFSRFCVGK